MKEKNYYTRQRIPDGFTEIVCAGCGACVLANKLVSDIEHALKCPVALETLSADGRLAREVRFRSEALREAQALFAA